MAQSLTLWLCCREADLPGSFAVLDRRLRHSASLTGGAILDRTERTARELKETRVDVVGLLHQARRTDSQLYLDYVYTLPRGEAFTVTVWVQSSGPRGGYGEEQGYLYLTFSEKDLVRVGTEADGARERRALYSPLSAPADAQDSVVMRDAVAFFTALVANQPNDPSPFPFAAMFVEGGLPSPLTCSMIYHRHATSLRMDLARSLVLGTERVQDHVSFYADTWNAEEQLLGFSERRVLPFPEPPTWLSEPALEAWYFYVSLDVATVLKLCRVPQPRLDDLVLEAYVHVPRLDLSVSSEDEIIIATHPQLLLAPFYKALAERL